jgi:hypothetical protein
LDYLSDCGHASDVTETYSTSSVKSDIDFEDETLEHISAERCKKPKIGDKEVRF